MGLTRLRLFALGLVLAACGGEPMPAQVDAPITPGGQCESEAQCEAPTPFCEPSTSTCVQCRFSSHCATSTGVCEAQTCRAARSCQELKDELPGLASGVYRVDLDGAGALEPIDVFCEMTVDGGGWTLIQRTRWTWSQSMALLTDYNTWHDTTVGSPAVGMAYRLAGQHWPAAAAGGNLMISHRVRTVGGGACNPLWYIGTGATVTVNRANKTASITGITQPVSIVNQENLSTTDSGSDATACVNTYSAVPWFYNQCCSTCPTFQGPYWNDSPHPMVAYVASVDDFFGNVETDVCAGQAIRVTDNASGHRGIDTMEMYLR